MQPESDRNFDNSNSERVYRIHLNPDKGAAYAYTVTNETSMSFEVEDKKVENQNKTNVEMELHVDKDSVGNSLFNMKYHKIKLYLKNGDNESDLDADNAANSFNATEKMLGILKSARIISNVRPNGEIKSITGYKELGVKLLEEININDIQARKIALEQWDKIAGESVIKQNLDQLFMIFPDSAIHVGDSWKITNRQSSGIPVQLKSTCTLKAINKSIAIVESEGKLSNDKANINVMGSNLNTNLEGTQESQFEVETTTGMLLSGRVRTKMEGKIQIMGREIPVIIKNSVVIKSQKF